MHVNPRPLVLGTAAALLAAAALLVLSDGTGTGAEKEEPDVRDGGTPAVRIGTVPAKRRPPELRPVQIVAAADDESLGEADRRLLDRLSNAVDNEDFERVSAMARTAGGIANPAVRKEIVAALGKFGQKALGHLEPFFDDADDEVATWAVDAWKAAVAEVEEDAERIGVLEKAASGTENPDALDAVFTEYIQMDEALAKQALRSLLAKGGSSNLVDKARETYALVAGADDEEGDAP